MKTKTLSFAKIDRLDLISAELWTLAHEDTAGAELLNAQRNFFAALKKAKKLPLSKKQKALAAKTLKHLLDAFALIQKANEELEKLSDSLQDTVAAHTQALDGGISHVA